MRAPLAPEIQTRSTLATARRSLTHMVSRMMVGAGTEENRGKEAVTHMYPLSTGLYRGEKVTMTPILNESYHVPGSIATFMEFSLV